MAWSSNLRKGVDLPTWDWLAFFPAGSSFPGTGHAYDGTRYIYWLVQIGSTTAASTTQLYRYDTWSEGWQFLAANTSSFAGASMEYDPVRNVLYVTTGNTGTEWRVFNLNTSNVIISNVTCTPFTFTTMTPVLPANAGLGGGLVLADDVRFADPAISGIATGGTTSTITVDSTTTLANQGQIGMAVRMTSGPSSGQRRIISAVATSGTTLTITVSSAFGSVIASGNTFIIEYPQGTATATFNTTTLADSTQTWATNFYANMDVAITAGTGVGQRKRIASNTATVLTLASTVTGNARTGAWATQPDATSVYKIVPSSDFLYYQSGASTQNLYRIDVNTGANAATWTTLTNIPAAINGGASIEHGRQTAPFALYIVRGAGTSSLYQYNIGLNTHTTLTTASFSGETLNTGASMTVLPENNKLWILKESATRIYTYRLSDGIVEPAGTMPYAAPSGNDGQRAVYLKTVDGVKWVYILRSGGQEYYRYALEWL
jgi:hypothetical protein